MCYSTAYWARDSKIYYAASWTDYADLFDEFEHQSRYETALLAANRQGGAAHARRRSEGLA